jgi:hypothetical protein
MFYQDPIADLEAHFELEIPCGGNSWPKRQQCPKSAAAVVGKVHTSCGLLPTSYKCIDCYATWLLACAGELDPVCRPCGLRMPAGMWYRAL